MSPPNHHVDLIGASPSADLEIVRIMRHPNVKMLSDEKAAVRSNTGSLSNQSRTLEPSINLFRSQGHSKAEDLWRPGKQCHGRTLLRLQVDMGR